MQSDFLINSILMIDVANLLKKLRKDASERSGIRLTSIRLAEEAAIPWSTYKGWEVPYRKKKGLSTDEIARLLPVFISNSFVFPACPDI